MKRILINAIHQEEIRVATIHSGVVHNLDIEPRSYTQTKSNIYLGTVKRIVPSLEAVFVEYGAAKQGFLPIKEIAPRYLTSTKDEKSQIAEGTKVIVQIVKEDRWNKGAALTTFISIAGKYLVIMPYNEQINGISKRLSAEDRDALRTKIEQLNIPKEIGVIVRTAGTHRSTEELQLDLDYLTSLWQSLNNKVKENKHPMLLFKESSLVIRVLRDYLQQDIEEVIIDDQKTYDECIEFVSHVIPPYRDKIKLYKEHTPIFSHFQVEKQIKTVFQREVSLPSGGSIVLDPTEALLSIDINSSKATSGQNINETALNTNLEAADEIARQLRLRDIGGLIVVDFIDMYNAPDKQKVEQRIKQALGGDHVRVQVSSLSEFGLVEISRQRLKPTISEISGMICTRCQGQGRIRNTESFALMTLRLIEEGVNIPGAVQIQASLPANIAAYLLNGKRASLLHLENSYGVEVIIVPNSGMHAPEYEVICVNENGSTTNIVEGSSTKQNIQQRTNTSNNKHKSAISWGTGSKEFSTKKRGFLAKLFCCFKKDNTSKKQKTSNNASNNNHYKKTNRNPKYNKNSHNRKKHK